MFGSWQVLLADLVLATDLTPGVLGATLAAGTAVSLPLMPLAGRLTDRRGATAAGALTAAVLVVGLLATAQARGVPAVVAATVVLLTGSGCYDVVINARAVALERTEGGRVLAVVHTGYSAAAAVAAVTTGLLLAAGTPFRVLYLAAAGVLAGCLLLSGRALPPAAPSARPTTGRPDPPRSWRRRGPLLLLGALTALAFLSEGAMENWSAVYLRAVLDLPVLVGAGGVAIFHAAMATGRLGVVGLVRRVPRPTLLRAAGIGIAGGMTLALATELPALVLTGFLVVGLSAAAVAPVAFSLVASGGEGLGGSATSVLTTLGYAGFLIGPALVGGLAELAGLRLALTAVIAAGLLLATLASVLAGDPPATVASQSRAADLPMR